MSSPIQHVVVFVKENHTFDNYFGQFPGANGIVLDGALNPPPSDLDHRHTAWMQRDTAVQGNYQYNEADIPGYYDLARRFTLCDNYFSEVAGPSTPNHLMLIAGAAPCINNPSSMNNPAPSQAYEMPSVPERLTAAGLTWGAYNGWPYPFGFVKGAQQQANMHTASAFAKDAAAGNLPNVSWVYADLSEHPPEDITAGMSYTLSQINALAAGPLWASTMIFLTWDDWGGWYDHVPPPNVEQWNPGLAQHTSEEYPSYTGQQYRYGSRVPCLVVGPYAKPGHVSHQLNSHVSIPAFIEDNWGLPACSGRDDRAAAMTDCYDYTQTPNPPYSWAPAPPAGMTLDTEGAPPWVAREERTTR